VISSLSGKVINHGDDIADFAPGSIALIGRGNAMLGAGAIALVGLCCSPRA
jgi:hypothetical protein